MKTLTKTLPDGRFIVAVIESPFDRAGGLFPAFTVTGSEWKSERHYRREWVNTGLYSCGCLHEILEETFPEIKPFISLHLCDASGIPMHGLENGWYWYSQGEIDRLAKGYRMDTSNIPQGLNREGFENFYLMQLWRWEFEVKEALRLYDSL